MRKQRKKEGSWGKAFPLLLLGIVLITLGFSIYGIFGFSFSPSFSSSPSPSSLPSSPPLAASTPPAAAAMFSSKMKPFDLALARQLMDKDNDGRCDACGMPLDMCIDGGELQCSMDPAGTIGRLGTSHHHADFAVFLNGKQLDFSDPKYFVKSAFIHVERDAKVNDAGKVLHVHAEGVPLWLFFASIGIGLEGTCLRTPQENFCTTGEKALRLYVNELRLYVNEKLNPDIFGYAPASGDRILLSYGTVAEIPKQLATVSDFAKLRKT